MFGLGFIAFMVVAAIVVLCFLSMTEAASRTRRRVGWVGLVATGFLIVLAIGLVAWAATVAI
jgi:multisubunit Na+/H+ antiporter MnhB subunit